MTYVLNKITSEKVKNTLIQGLFLLMTMSFHAHGATSTLVDELSKADRRQVQTMLGYVFKGPHLLQEAFTHSSAGNTSFEAWEGLGDALIKGCMADGTILRTGATAEDVHESLSTPTTNAHFARRYKAWGLDAFLRYDSTADRDTVCANAMEALVASVAEDYYARHPHLKGTGRVFKTLVGVVRRLVVDPISAPLMRAVPSAPSSKSKAKVQVELRLEKAGQMHRQKGGGSTEEEARTKALKALWAKLGMPTRAKGKPFSTLAPQCRSNGWVLTERSL